MSGGEGGGNVEAKVRADIDALVTTHPMGEALAATALELARTLDGGAGLAVAAVARELRATLTELASMEVPDDDGLDAALSTPTPGVPAEVRDTEDTGAADARPRGRGGRKAVR